jgi:hypothetical protein
MGTEAVPRCDQQTVGCRKNTIGQENDHSTLAVLAQQHVLPLAHRAIVRQNRIRPRT